MKGEKIYIIGIEGAGTSALARLLAARGAIVSGSDEGDGFYGEILARAKIVVHRVFDVTNIPEEITFAVRSTSVGEDNVEVAELLARGVDVKTYPEALAALLDTHFGIAVAGTHGKTTTTGFLAEAFLGAGTDVSAIVGAPVAGWDGGARAGTSDMLIIEADEYQDKLALYNPQAAILTTCDFDHPDFFVDFDAYKDVFKRFVERIPHGGILIANSDDANVMEVAAHAVCRVIRCGVSSDADVVISSRTQLSTHQEITVQRGDETHIINAHLPGPHNAFNAVMAWTLAATITENAEGAAEGISQFPGVARRFEMQGEYKDAILVDDYAHHPEELRVSLKTARELYASKKLIVAFHPHTYSRTEALLDDFAQVLRAADHVIVMAIYGSAREEKGTVEAHDLVRAINHQNTETATYVASIEDLAVWAQEHLGEGDVFLTCGAGDIWKVHGKIKNI